MAELLFQWKNQSTPKEPPVAVASIGRNNNFMDVQENGTNSGEYSYNNDTSGYENSSIYGNDTGIYFESYEYPMVFQVCIYIVYNAVFVFAVLGNLLVIYVIGSSARMRTVTNYLIGNLALGDLLMALLCVPFSYISVLYQYWPFGHLLCHLVTPAQAVCVFVSAYTLVALAIDRYLAILYPLRPRLRKTQALVVIAVVWIVALLTAVPIAVVTRLGVDENNGQPLCDEWGWDNEKLKMGYGLALLVLQYFFPITVLIYTYTRIALEIWWKKKPLDSSNGELARVVDQSREIRLTKARRKTVVMTLCVVAGYTLAWLPINLFRLYLDSLTYDPNEERLPYLEYIFFACHWLAMAHTTYNPIIYAWVNSKFRAAFASVLGNLFGQRQRNQGMNNRQLGHFQGQGSSLSRVEEQVQRNRINHNNHNLETRVLAVETRLIIDAKGNGNSSEK